MGTLTLDQLSLNDTALITKLNTSNLSYRNKLLAMGITPGCKVTIVRKAPLGDPIQITIRGFQLCLRKAEASGIQVALED
ncbi:ferrous iron transport protein A [Ignatzschineria rhizosphaerae]|uniref:Ferrous iron transport protein A n=1 Tax=Ignatzschineria rhizosphaerae TaxID=2923279 RepID=A0ABY3X1S4_9GAMM|nr:FeoA family protein [Ignatzschineria rhizosphaerae]UNM95644.1 ferrous iron transport protein A [Ignatzschineria rhizosphaerae]